MKVSFYKITTNNNKIKSDKNMVKVLKSWENTDKTYMESFYSIAGNSILHWRTQYKGEEQEIKRIIESYSSIIDLEETKEVMHLISDLNELFKEKLEMIKSVK